MEDIYLIDVILNLLVTVLVYVTPPVVYTFVVRKEKLESSDAFKVCLITAIVGCLVFMAVRAVLGMTIFWSFGPALLWSGIAFSIIRKKASAPDNDNVKEWEDPGFGYTADKPIIAKGYEEQINYLKSLVTDDGNETTFKFAQIAYCDDDDEKREVYRITAEGIEPTLLFFNREGNHTSAGTPKGFRFNDVSVEENLNKPSECITEKNFASEVSNSETKQDVNTESDENEKGSRKNGTKKTKTLKQGKATMVLLILLIAMVLVAGIFATLYINLLGDNIESTDELKENNKKLYSYKTVVINYYGKDAFYVYKGDEQTYHRPGCKYAPENADFWVLNPSAAEDGGSKPCPYCVDGSLSDYIEETF